MAAADTSDLYLREVVADKGHQSGQMPAPPSAGARRTTSTRLFRQ